MFHIHLLLLPAGGELVSLGHRLLSLFSETIQIHDKPSYFFRITPESI
jgi:hypothetical protein